MDLEDIIDSIPAELPHRQAIIDCIRRDTRLRIALYIHQLKQRGYPLSKTSDNGAYTLAADRFGCAENTVIAAYQQYKDSLI